MALTLILGGAHSGKSEHLHGVLPKDVPCWLLGMASLESEEMLERVSYLKSQRSLHWQSHDWEGQSLVGLLKETTADFGTICMDGLNLWLAQLIRADAGKYDGFQMDKRLTHEVGQLVLFLKEVVSSRFFIATAEMGVSPPASSPLDRLLRKHCGLLNQALARISEKVIYMEAGIARSLK